MSTILKSDKRSTTMGTTSSPPTHFDSPSKAQPGVISPEGSSIWLPLTLNYPDDPGKLIKNLSGSVAVKVVPRAAAADPLATEVAFAFAGVPMP